MFLEGQSAMWSRRRRATFGAVGEVAVRLRRVEGQAVANSWHSALPCWRTASRGIVCDGGLPRLSCPAQGNAEIVISIAMPRAVADADPREEAGIVGSRTIGRRQKLGGRLD